MSEVSRASRFARWLIRQLDQLVNALVVLAFLLVIGYGCYALWDSHAVSSAALPQQYGIYKPTEDTLGFEELQAINPEVFAWLTIYGTPIDYPLLQAENNSKYISTNAEGNYSLTGSLFLDYRNDKSFQDFNSIVYGHNMVPQVMFGSIKEFREDVFFREHRYGELFYDGRTHGLEFFAYVDADAYDDTVYRFIKQPEHTESYIARLQELAVQWRELEITPEDHIVLLSTCSPTSTNGRNILAGRITDELFEDAWYVEPVPPKPVVRITGVQWAGFALWFWIMAVLLALLILIALILAVYDRVKRRKHEE